MSEENAHENGQVGAPGDDDGSAEAKRIAARRRFLTGGAVALPLILSVSRETFATYYYYGGSKKTVGKSVCISIGTVIGKDKKSKFNSVICRVKS